MERFAIVEMMGHRRFGARVTEVEEFGVKFCRAEILVPNAEPIVQLVAPASVYAITFCDEIAARRVNQDAWSLRQAVPGLPEPAPTRGSKPFDGEDAETCADCETVLPVSEMRHDDEGIPLCQRCYDEVLLADEHPAAPDAERSAQ